MASPAVKLKSTVLMDQYTTSSHWSWALGHEDRTHAKALWNSLLGTWSRAAFCLSPSSPEAKAAQLEQCVESAFYLVWESSLYLSYKMVNLPTATSHRSRGWDAAWDVPPFTSSLLQRFLMAEIFFSFPYRLLTTLCYNIMTDTVRLNTTSLDQIITWSHEKLSRHFEGILGRCSPHNSAEIPSTAPLTWGNRTSLVQPGMLVRQLAKYPKP